MRTALALFAAALVAAAQDPPKPATAELLQSFLEGSDAESAKARESLLASGKTALPAAALRLAERRDAKRVDALAELVFELKRAGRDVEAGAVLARLAGTEIEVDFKEAGLASVVDYLREFLIVNIVADPDAAKALESRVTLALKGVKARAVLERALAPAGLDYDVRLGVLYLARPERLWKADAGLPAAAAWRSQELDAPGRGIADKLDAIKVDLDLKEATLDALVEFLREISGLNLAVAEAAKKDAAPVTLRLHDLPMGRVLELATLPRGLDVRIADGVILVDKARKM